MSKDYTNILLSFCLLAVISGCSTQKNTRASRSYHATKVLYNIQYNGTLSYNEGMKAIAKAAQDDYSTVLPLYPISDHNAANSASGQMDRTIEKCRKSIKLHSIKAKPKADPKKRQDAKYQQWLKSEEFNPAMGDVWIRLGEAEFHKGDFLGATATLGYVARHFSNNPDMVARAQLMMARSYGELGWLYEAEDALQRTKADDLKRKNAAAYAAAMADVYIKAGKYHEAIPFVKLAMPAEKRKINRPRFAFVLGQLYAREGRRDEAIAAYKRCIRMTPAETMDFHARLNRAELEGEKSVRKLKKMAKLSKNEQRQDAIYNTIGNIYLVKRDTTTALDWFEQAIAASAGGKAKSSVLLKAADIYFGRRQYDKAQPLYAEALTIITAEHADYDRVSRLSEVLDELIVPYNTVVLQDSLQHLSTLSDEQQMQIAQQLVADLLEQERQDSARMADATRQAELNARDGGNSVNTSNMVGGTKSGEFYFYNQQLIQQGKTQFRKQWGSRSLEDNWRWMQKAMATIPEETVDETASAELEQSTDSTSATASDAEQEVRKVVSSSDPHDVNYYLAQIPRTDADIHRSDSLIADALYAMIPIYRNKLKDELMAEEVEQDLRRRFPTDSRLAEMDRVAEIRRRIASDPTYLEAELRKIHGADSLYVRTYDAYTHAKYKEVRAYKQQAETEYPDNRLMPRFLFLNAVAVARTSGQSDFVVCLQDLVERYPDSELSTMSRDMLAMMGQGMSTKKSQMENIPVVTEELQTKAESIEDELEQQMVAVDHVVLTAAEGADEQVVNEILYEVALFNFSNFMIRDFDLRVQGRKVYVEGFENPADVDWYIGMMRKSAETMNRLMGMGVTIGK